MIIAGYPRPIHYVNIIHWAWERKQAVRASFYSSEQHKNRQVKQATADAMLFSTMFR